MSADFEAKDDAALKDLIRDAQALLERREQERRKTALAEIRRIASGVGVVVEVREQKRRGRPPKQSAEEGRV